MRGLRKLLCVRLALVKAGGKRKVCLTLHVVPVAIAVRDRPAQEVLAEGDSSRLIKQGVAQAVPELCPGQRCRAGQSDEISAEEHP